MLLQLASGQELHHEQFFKYRIEDPSIRNQVMVIENTLGFTGEKQPPQTPKTWVSFSHSLHNSKYEILGMEK